ncbi:MAG: hypothetical protein RL616_2624 [Verrucomicrobiota bacterium]
MALLPQLSVRRGREAVAFYIAAFDAVEVYRVGGKPIPTNDILHIGQRELRGLNLRNEQGEKQNKGQNKPLMVDNVALRLCLPAKQALGSGYIHPRDFVA